MGRGAFKGFHQLGKGSRSHPAPRDPTDAAQATLNEIFEHWADAWPA